ncbi:MAG: transposase [Bacteroidales bacterium]|nr:transposase [Bacteroidales bacterium]
MNEKAEKIKNAAILIEKFTSVFPDEEHCLDLLAQLKWKEGFVCRHCGHTNWCHGKSVTSRRCTTCKREESATAHTIFHHCRFSLKSAIELSLLLCHIPDISSYELSRQVKLRHMTCYQFQKKMLICQQGQPENKLVNELLSEVAVRLEN